MEIPLFYWNLTEYCLSNKSTLFCKITTFNTNRVFIKISVKFFIINVQYLRKAWYYSLDICFGVQPFLTVYVKLNGYGLFHLQLLTPLLTMAIVFDFYVAICKQLYAACNFVLHRTVLKVLCVMTDRGQFYTEQGCLHTKTLCLPRELNWFMWSFSKVLISLKFYMRISNYPNNS